MNARDFHIESVIADPALREKFIRRFLGHTRRTASGCLEWQRYRTAKGYGHFGLGPKIVAAHRFAYIAFRGPIPEGLVLDHVVCDNPSCVDHWHVEPATNAANVLRSPVAFCAINARKTHCPKGHPFDEIHTYHRLDGKGKFCRTCNRERCAARRARLAA